MTRLVAAAQDWTASPTNSTLDILRRQVDVDDPNESGIVYINLEAEYVKGGSAPGRGSASAGTRGKSLRWRMPLKAWHRVWWMRTSGEKVPHAVRLAHDGEVDSGLSDGNCRLQHSRRRQRNAAWRPLCEGVHLEELLAGRPHPPDVMPRLECYPPPQRLPASPSRSAASPRC